MVLQLQGVLLHSDGEVRAPGGRRGHQGARGPQGPGRQRDLQGAEPALQPQQPHRGAAKLPVRRGADAQGVLQGHPDGQGLRAVVEEVDLQGHLADGRPRPRVLQVTQLPRTARMKREQASCSPSRAVLPGLVKRFL